MRLLQKSLGGRSALWCWGVLAELPQANESSNWMVGEFSGRDNALITAKLVVKCRVAARKRRVSAECMT